MIQLDRPLLCHRCFMRYSILLYLGRNDDGDGNVSEQSENILIINTDGEDSL